MDYERKQQIQLIQQIRPQIVYQRQYLALWIFRGE